MPESVGIQLCRLVHSEGLEGSSRLNAELHRFPKTYCHACKCLKYLTCCIKALFARSLHVQLHTLTIFMFMTAAFWDVTPCNLVANLPYPVSHSSGQHVGGLISRKYRALVSQCSYGLEIVARMTCLELEGRWWSVSPVWITRSLCMSNDFHTMYSKWKLTISWNTLEWRC
jgi:hypothetical protein